MVLHKYCGEKSEGSNKSATTGPGGLTEPSSLPVQKYKYHTPFLVKCSDAI